MLAASTCDAAERKPSPEEKEHLQIAWASLDAFQIRIHRWSKIEIPRVLEIWNKNKMLDKLNSWGSIVERETRLTLGLETRVMLDSKCLLCFLSLRCCQTCWGFPEPSVFTSRIEQNYQ